MIYTGTVRPSIMKAIDKPIMTFFKEYLMQELDVPDTDEQYVECKQFKIEGFISGEMSDLVRNNDNVVSRDCLILDLDDVKVSESEMLDIFKQKFSKFEYVVYPSFGHGLKGIRYRLVLPLDKAVGSEEYKQLIEFFTTIVLKDVIGIPDESNSTWSQIMLLPVLTQYVTKEQIYINETGKCMQVDDCLKSVGQVDKKIDTLSKVPISGKRYRTKTTELFESLVVGCEEGNRNNTITKIVGGLLFRAVDVEVVWRLTQIANDNFTVPLSQNELEKTFISILRKERRAD